MQYFLIALKFVVEFHFGNICLLLTSNMENNMRFIVNSASAFALVFGISACEPTEPATEEDPVTCTPYSIVNERINGLGMDLCSDGSVVNWDGLHVGVVEAVEGSTVTINWSGGPVLGSETFEAHSTACRQGGLLKDCS